MRSPGTHCLPLVSEKGRSCGAEAFNCRVCTNSWQLVSEVSLIVGHSVGVRRVGVKDPTHLVPEVL